jgi:hypothetical protein
MLAVSSTRARACRGSSLLWRISSSWLRDGMAGEEPSLGAGANGTGGRSEAVHSHASGENAEHDFFQF